MRAVFSDTIESGWASLPTVVLGSTCIGHEADRHVIVTRAGASLLRLEIYARRADCCPFEEVIIWQSHVAVGFGSDVHLVSLLDFSAVSVPLGSYFGHFYPSGEYLLVASGERVFRIERDRHVLWRSEVLGIDGVIVSDTGPPLVRGEGEWDPPGGWAPFALQSETGAVVQRAP